MVPPSHVLPKPPTVLTPPSQAATELPAFILGLLTSIGGITGYVRTGSVPSIAAGLTVGALVRFTSPRLQLLFLLVFSTT